MQTMESLKETHPESARTVHLLLGDTPSFSRAVASLFESEPSLQVIGEVATDRVQCMSCAPLSISKRAITAFCVTGLPNLLM